jgi:hypothetical protein
MGATNKTPKPGRNQPCPCGSGKKYKNCHELEVRIRLQKRVMEVNAEKMKESKTSRR